jgi:glycine/D-amino acid oxidase-like deaminating enzyme
MREELVKEGASSISLLKKDSAASEKLRVAGFPNDLDWLWPDGLIRYESMSGPGETAQVHPYLFTTSMAKLAEEKGTRIILGTVEKICQATEGVESIAYIDKASGELCKLPATDVVISAGPWTRAIFSEAPISSIRAHSVVIRPTRPVSAYTLFTNIELPGGAKKGSRSTIITPEIYARPDNTVYACGEGDQLVPVPPTTADVQVDLSRCQDIIDSTGSISEELKEGEVMMRQACYLPSVNAPRGGPLIGHTWTKGLYMATGHTCWGIQNAPGTGKLVSEFIFEGEAKSANVTALDPRKFL